MFQIIPVSCLIKIFALLSRGSQHASLPVIGSFFFYCQLLFYAIQDTTTTNQFSQLEVCEIKFVSLKILIVSYYFMQFKTMSW